jgi:putative protease
LDENKNLICEKFTMSAKDMCLLTKVDEMIDIGVASFKIEGRMKSEHYIATVVNAYRKIIDSYYSNNHTYDNEYYEDVKRAANRETDLA